MATEFLTVTTEMGELSLTQYARGRDRGVGCQVSVRTAILTVLTPQEAAQVGAALLTWAVLSGLTPGELLAYAGSSLAVVAERIDGVTVMVEGDERR